MVMILSVLYGVLPLCGLSMFFALRKRSKPGIGIAIAIANLLGTIHVFSYTALWSELFRKTPVGPGWQFLAVCRETPFAAGYGATLLIASAACLFLNVCIFAKQRHHAEMNIYPKQA